MKVNNTSTVNVSHQEAVEALKAAGGTVTLVTACFYLSTISSIMIQYQTSAVMFAHNFKYRGSILKAVKVFKVVFILHFDCCHILSYRI